ncbi:MAG TPA: ROK family protein [Rectinemataceae bacterium]|nr:ROK family protein [Rectinemataceae bacterium]
MGMKLSNLECVLALDAGGTGIKLGLATSRAADEGILDLDEISMPSDGSVEDIEAAYARAAGIGMACASGRGLEIAGVGVSTPGPFDYANGVSMMSHKCAAIKGMSVRAFISRAFIGKAAGPAPVRFIHDAFAFLLGELAFGAGCPEGAAAEAAAPSRSPCAATIGTGLGFAAIAEGKLLRGPEGGPAISIYKSPYRRGIAEDYVSKRGIMDCYERLGGFGRPGVKEIADRAKEGDALCAMVFEETGIHLAEILAPFILKGGFDRLILGGQIAKAGTLLTEPTRRRFEVLGIRCPVSIARHIDEAPLLGAAQLFLGEEALS